MLKCAVVAKKDRKYFICSRCSLHSDTWVWNHGLIFIPVGHISTQVSRFEKSQMESSLRNRGGHGWRVLGRLRGKSHIFITVCLRLTVALANHQRRTDIASH